ncbi:hypothetical protein IGI04_037786 [Brassica rapa subsp. trilocularis]|uniref:Protein kinase domain-containing protein n=1 Tax=Brassica rapa subsp. trilocularis TaxID=1813537 RepID=A0ABQ7LM84_BRACM|nr:hypothetical protein IGI04_037786 [Brassica rapa subsp. trilocularis]
MSNAICVDRFVWYKGTIENRTVLIKKYNEESIMMIADNIYRDIAVSSMMSSQKNVLKLLGCCLEFPSPVLVCEYPENGALTGKYAGEGIKPLSWNVRLKIAREIADAVTYLHTQFPRIIIHRDLKLNNIFLDENWTAKLTSFSLSIPIPEGESGVEDMVVGTTPHVEPEYTATGFVTENVDVYSLGSMMLSLLTGKSWFNHHPDEDDSYKLLHDYVEECLRQGMFTKLIDPSMGDNVPDHSRVQMEAFVELALRCIGLRPGEDKPRMIDLLGCCLEFEYLVLVCEYAERIPYNTPNLVMLIKMAKEIAVALSYLHTAFTRTMVHMDIQPSNIFLDSNGTAKLRKRGVVDRCRGDERLFEYEYSVMNLRVSDRVCKFVEEGRIFEILDQKLFGVEQERRRMEAVIMLSLRCTGHRGTSLQLNSHQAWNKRNSLIQILSESGTPEYSPKTGRSSSTVKVRLLRFWETRNVRRGGELMGVHILLLDSQSTMMPATVSVNSLATHQPNLEAGSVYSLTGFDVTRCNQNYRLSDSPLLVRFSDSTSFKKHRDPPQDENHVMATIKMENDMSVTMSLFDAQAVKIHNQLEKMGVDPRVVVATSVNPKMVGGKQPV